MIKELPKYFIIKRDDKNPLWEKYILWLNKTYKINYGGTVNNFYGYDGNHDNNGTNCWYHKVSFRNNPVELTLEEWDSIINKKALDMNEKKIIGYKLIKPEYLEAANEICKKVNTGTSIEEFSFLRIGINRLSIPALKDAGVLDIWFEPVYEPEKPKEKVITVNDTRISIKQGSIYAVDRSFKIESIKHLLGLMSSNYNKDFWNTEFTEVKIGCKTGWTKKHLEEIVKEYEEFNK